MRATLAQGQTISTIGRPRAIESRVFFVSFPWIDLKLAITFFRVLSSSDQI
jgi:hypothetical protein